MAKKTATALKPKAVKKKKSKRTRWLDPRTDTPLLQRYARRMKSFLDAMADGVIEKHELKEQEARLVALMKEVEPKLEDSLHEKVTNLLCELAVYDLMQMLHTMQEARPAPRFRG
jgi:hypothetical protein